MPTLAPRRVLLSQLDTLLLPCPVRVVGIVVRMTSEFIVLDDGSHKMPLLCAQHDTSKGTLGDTIMALADWNGETLQATTIMWDVNRNMEALQWQEALYSGPTSNGYPCIPVDKAEVFRFLSLEGGIGLEDLALVLNLTLEEMNVFIQQLQEEGAIYLNRQGLFVPL
jgi:hypothetical protein